MGPEKRQNALLPSPSPFFLCTSTAQEGENNGLTGIPRLDKSVLVCDPWVSDYFGL